MKLTNIASLLLAFPFTSHGATNELVELRERTRLIVNTVHCAHCHTPGLATTKQNALKVYDLSAPYWSSSMNDRQLRDFRRRLKDKLTPAELKVMGGDPKKEKPLSKDQVKIVDSFIEKELQHRRAEPLDRFHDLQREKYPEVSKILGLWINSLAK